MVNVFKIALLGGIDAFLFATHTFLMNFTPLVLTHIDEPLYNQIKDQLLKMTYSDYFYIVSYPTYDGHKIEHDPIYIVFFAPTTTTAAIDETATFGGILLVGAIAAIVLVAVIVFFEEKSEKIMHNSFPVIQLLK